MNCRIAFSQHGQSMTEFVVAAAFVMVPLFLIVPAVGKYIDIKLATVQAARYASWEYTANYVDLNDQPGGFRALPQTRLPKKTVARVAGEARKRYFSNTALPLSSTLDLAYDNSLANPMWQFHNGLAMYTGDGDTLEPEGSKESPDQLGVSTIFGTVGTVVGFYGSALQALGLDVGFDVMNPDGNFTIDGRFTASVIVPVQEAPDYTALAAGDRAPLFGQPLDLRMRARSGILTESWAAGGKDHTLFQAGALMPAVLFERPLRPVQTIIRWISPELSPDSLKIGYPIRDPDALDIVPVGALENDPRQIDCPGNYCED